MLEYSITEIVDDTNSIAAMDKRLSINFDLIESLNVLTFLIAFLTDIY